MLLNNTSESTQELAYTITKYKLPRMHGFLIHFIFNNLYYNYLSVKDFENVKFHGGGTSIASWKFGEGKMERVGKHLHRLIAMNDNERKK